MILAINILILIILGGLAWLFVRLGREPGPPRTPGGRGATLAVALAVVVLAAGAGRAQSAAAAGDSGPALPNTRCPVLTDELADPAFHVTHEGREVYFCCAACRRKFLADPQAYLANLPQFGGAPPPQGAPAAPPAGDRPATLGEALGRFHPVVLHLPIALILAALAAELLAMFGGWEIARRAVPFLVLAAAPSAVATSLLGLALAAARSAPGAAATLHLHRTAGLVATGLALLLALALPWRDARGARRALFVTLLALAAAAVVAAGHWGGVLVWGAEWLPL